MILATGHVTARPETLDEMLRLSLEHVERSRKEPGCLFHSVHQDVENPHRIVFLEHWADRASLAAHFAVPESGAFVRALYSLAGDRGRMDVYGAEPTRI